MLNQNAVDMLNDHLEKVQQSINELSEQDAQYQQLLADLNIAIRISVDDEISKVEEIRKMLFNLRRRLNSLTASSSQRESCKKNIHEALCGFTQCKPLNKERHGHKICPFSKRLIEPSDKIALSNGYYYSEEALDESRAGKSHFPALPNISQFDADAIHEPAKKTIIYYGARLSLAIAPLFVLADVFLTKLAPFSMVGLAVKGLGLLGIGGFAAVGITVGGFFVLVAALAAIGIVIAINVYDKQNGSKLAPVASTTALRGDMPGDESRSEHEEDETRSLLPAPSATESEKIVRLDADKQSDESASDDDELAAASGVAFK